MPLEELLELEVLDTPESCAGQPEEVLPEALPEALELDEPELDELELDELELELEELELEELELEELELDEFELEVLELEEIETGFVPPFESLSHPTRQAVHTKSHPKRRQLMFFISAGSLSSSLLVAPLLYRVVI